MDKMQDVLNLVDEYINLNKLLTQTSTKSPYYDIIKIFTSQTKNKIITLLETKNNKTFYDYIVLQKQKSKVINQDMPELNFIIDYGEITFNDINELKLFFMLSYKQAVNATFDITQKQQHGCELRSSLELMIFNNNNIIKILEEQQQHDQEHLNELEDLIYLLKIKNQLYKHIYTKITTE